jgi:hypothetical protein
MEDIFDFLGLFLIVVIAVAVNKAKKQNKGKGPAPKPYSKPQDLSRFDVRQNASPAGTRQAASNRAAYARELKTKDSATARSNYGRSAYEFDSSLRAAAASGKSHDSGLRSSTVLHDDRQNDWMAQQLRYERRVKASTDLGAVHDANCDARSLKREHLAVHGKY